MTQLDHGTASRFAQLTLGHLTREYPNKLDHVLNGPEDVSSPSVLHPIFYGSFDWHSCVHGWWQVMRLLRRFPDLPEAAEIRALADRMLTPENVAGELAYLDRPSSAGFERPYGWAWLLALHAELAEHPDDPWADHLAPLARAFAGAFADYLPRLTYPIRVGTHYNIAFALVLAFDWSERHQPRLAEAIRRHARRWFDDDVDCQAWEPSSDEFLSPSLIEALLMSRILPRKDFLPWFDRFLPRLRFRRPATLFQPAIVSDRSDGKIAHLDGLNFSRAWCFRSIADRLGAMHDVSSVLNISAEQHIRASLPHISTDYMGEHWLATFALLALEA